MKLESAQGGGRYQMPIFTVHTIWNPLPFSKNAKNVCSSKDILLYFSPKDIISCSISALITKKEERC